jgi:heme-degrading monooxygenase HmoA
LVLRMWRGCATPANAGAYVQHLTGTVFPKLRSIGGFRGASLLKKEVGAGAVEFLVMTRWASMDALQAFAGPDPSKAVVEPAAAAVLLDFDCEVKHYEIEAEILVGGN